MPLLRPQRTSIKTSWLQLFVLNNLSLMLADHFKKFTTHPPRTPPAIHQNGSLVRKEGNSIVDFSTLRMTSRLSGGLPAAAAAAPAPAAGTSTRGSSTEDPR